MRHPFLPHIYGSIHTSSLRAYGGAVGGGIAIGGVIGYVGAAAYAYFAREDLDRLKVASHVGFYSGWTVLVAIVFHLIAD